MTFLKNFINHQLGKRDVWTRLGFVYTVICVECSNIYMSIIHVYIYIYICMYVCISIWYNNPYNTHMVHEYNAAILSAYNYFLNIGILSLGIRNLYSYHLPNFKILFDICDQISKNGQTWHIKFDCIFHLCCFITDDLINKLKSNFYH